MAECQLEIPKVKGLEDSTLTVGRLFLLNCKGSFTRIDRPEPWRAEWDKEQDPLVLKILSSDFVAVDQLQLVAASYRVGQHQVQNLKIKSGLETLELGPIQFEVKTVIEKKDEQVEPYGPMAATLRWPMALWLSLLVVALFVVFFGFFRWRRYRQRKELLENLRQHDAALPPLAEVHQKYRKWRREKAFFHGAQGTPAEVKETLLEVDKAFRVYLIRAFKIPALQWNDSLILKDLKKRHRPIFDEWHNAIKKYMIELGKAKAAADLKDKDVVQLTEDLRRLAENLEKGNRKEVRL